MIRLVGILGYPLAHSISPAFQQAAFDYCSLPIRYGVWSTPPARLGEEVGRLRGEDYLGANVTVPHKEQVRAFLDRLDPWAVTVGAVNTIVKEGSILAGYNTDAYGFIKPLKEHATFNLRGARVLLLGAGGAARAAAFGLAKEGISSLVIANRDLRRAEVLAHDIQGLLAPVRAVPLTDAALAKAAADASLIVNSTSVGMAGGDGERETLLKASLIPAHSLVYDMVYNPPDTPLLQESRAAGARTLGGLPMLIYQGAAAFEYWTGRQAPVEIMFQAGEKALADLTRPHPNLPPRGEGTASS